MAVFAGFAALAAASPSAGRRAQAAESEADEPERLIRIGNELRRKGDNVRAFGYLQRAYDLSHTPRAAAQLGLCEEAIGRFHEAEDHLTEALASHDAWVDAKRQALEETRVSGRRHLGHVKVTAAPPGTTASVGDRPPQKLPADGNLWAAPGPVTLTFAAEGYRRSTKAVTLTMGEEVTVEAGLMPLTSSTASPPPTGPTTANPSRNPVVGSVASDLPIVSAPLPRHEPRATNGQEQDRRGLWRLTGLALGGAGAAMVAGGLALELIAAHKYNAINDDAHAERPYDPANGNWKTFEGGAIALFVTGGAALVTGTSLYLLNRAPDEANELGRVADRGKGASSRRAWWPTISFGGAGTGAAAGVSGRF